MLLSRSVGTTLLLLCGLWTATETALAKPSKRTPASAAPVAIQIPHAAPARFFTINQILARQSRRTTSTLTLANAEAAGSGSDGPPAAVPPLVSSEPFGLVAFRAPEGQLCATWRLLQAELQTEARQVAHCRLDPGTCSAAARRFLALAAAAHSQQGRARIQSVNRAVNFSVRYTSDFAQHGVADHWSAPLATLASSRGDCEDYAIAKYVLLHDAGVSEDDMRLLLVRDRRVQQDHAVLAVRSDGEWLILDNRTLTLTTASSLPHFLPLFSLNQDGVSLVAAPYAMSAEAPAMNKVAGPGASERKMVQATTTEAMTQ
jgi:predicted transglutaminase-like cysteine proteinase